MERYANNVTTTLAASAASGDATISVTSSSGFPSLGNFRVVIDSEILLVTSVSGATFTVTRGVEGTTAAAHASGAALGLVLTSLSLQAVAPHPCQGRLTLTSGAPVTTSDVTGSTVYFTPYGGNRLLLWNGNDWELYGFAEVSVAAPALYFCPFDIFASSPAAPSNNASLSVNRWDGGSQTTYNIIAASNATPIVITTGTANILANGDLVGINGCVGNTAPNNQIWTVANISGPQFQLAGSTGNGTWTSGGTVYKVPGSRAGALTTQDGAYVLGSDKTKRYLGTCMTHVTSGTVEDSAARRLCWNYYNRKPRPLLYQGLSGNWTYATAAWRPANATPAARVELILGVTEDLVSAQVGALVAIGAGASGSLGIGLDALTAATVDYNAEVNVSSGASCNNPGFAAVSRLLAAGYHYLGWLEYARVGTASYYATLGGTQGGLAARLEG